MGYHILCYAATHMVMGWMMQQAAQDSQPKKVRPKFGNKGINLLHQQQTVLTGQCQNTPKKVGKNHFHSFFHAVILLHLLF